MPPTAAAIPAPPDAPDSEYSLTPGSADGRLVSEAEYWRDWYGVSDIVYEWNNGRLEEKPVSDYETSLVYKWVLLLLELFLAERPIATTVTLDMGFRLPLPTGTVVRRPDLAVVRRDNPMPLAGRDRSYRGVYDICIEALSDAKRGDILRDTVTKKAEYSAGGVGEYWILHRSPERQAFYRRTPAGLYAPIEPRDGVIESGVLPGFRFRLDDIERQPGWIALRDDPVYADFVLPQWTRDRQAAAAGAERAAAEAAARRELERQGLAGVNIALLNLSGPFRIADALFPFARSIKPIEQGGKPLLVEDGATELLGAIELAAGVAPGDDIVGLARDAR